MTASRDTFQRKLVLHVVPGGAALLYLGFALVGAAYCLYFRTPFPFREMAEIMEFLDANPAVFTGDTFTKLNEMEHRPALPGLIWHLDRDLFGSAGLFPLMLSYSMLAATAYLIVSAWVPKAHMRRTQALSLFAAALAAMFSLTNWENLIWEIQLHVAMCLLFTTLAFRFSAQTCCAIKVGAPKRARRAFLCATVFASLSQFSFGYGIITMPIVLAVGLLCYWPVRLIIASAIASVALLGTYVVLVSLGGRTHPAALGESVNLIALIEYSARLLAASIVPGDLYGVGVRETVALGAGGALLALYLFGGATAAISLRQRYLNDEVENAQVFCLAMSSFCVAIAVVTPILRPDETGGLVDRYALVGCVFALSLPGLLPIRCLSASGEKGSISPSFLIAALYASVGVWGTLVFGHMPPVRWHQSAVAAIGADMGLQLSEPIEIVGPALHEEREKAHAVWVNHRQRLAARGEYEPFTWLGRKLSAVVSAHSEAKCELTQLRVVDVPGHPGAFAFSGTFKAEGEAAFPKNWAVIVDGTNSIVGLAATRMDFVELPPAYGLLGLIGFSKRKMPWRVTGYFLAKVKFTPRAIVMDGGRGCMLGGVDGGEGGPAAFSTVAH